MQTSGIFGGFRSRSPSFLYQGSQKALFTAVRQIVIRIAIAPLLLLPVLCAPVSFAQNPGPHWLMYKTPEDAGWSSRNLTAMSRVANASSVLLVQKGKVVFAYGEYWRRTKSHSLRKSFLGALYGIAIRQGAIDTLATIGQLGIASSPPLTDAEKQARVIDLLTCRSGVYLPSGQETEDMALSRPERGSHPPGTVWYYNNWDFNVLGTIFRELTGRDIFEAFRSDIAESLQMEDFRALDGAYELSPADSFHPGYMFKLSARDAARFGQLFLQNGSWDGAEVVPDWWVGRSTTSYSATTTPGVTYGLLWWVVENFRGVKMYYAAGYGGQRICVLPALELVVVITSDTYSNNTVLDVDYLLPDLVFTARVGRPTPNPEFVPLGDPPTQHATRMDSATELRYVGDHILGGIPVTISRSDEGLLLDRYHYHYRFRLLPLSEAMFHIEDIDELLVADLDMQGYPKTFTVHKSSTTYELYRLIKERGIGPASTEFPSYATRFGKKEELEFLCNQLAAEGMPTVALRELNAVRFPYSYVAQRDLKDELLATMNIHEASRVFRRLADSLRREGFPGTKTEWFSVILVAFDSPGRLTAPELQDFVGTFGHRHITSDNGSLYYQTGDRKRRLFRMSDGRFAIEGTYNMVIDFGHEDDGKVCKITGRYYRDSFDETYRTP